MARSINALKNDAPRLKNICVYADEVKVLIQAGAKVETRVEAPNGNFTFVKVTLGSRGYSWKDLRKGTPGEPAGFLGLPS